MEMSTAVTLVAMLLALLLLLNIDKKIATRLCCKMMPGSTLKLRKQMVDLIELKIAYQLSILNYTPSSEVVKIQVRENEPSQFQDEDIYVRAYREMIYVTSFQRDIIEPLNIKLTESGIEVYQNYLCCDSKGVYLVVEVRAKPI